MPREVREVAWSIFPTSCGPAESAAAGAPPVWWREAGRTGQRVCSRMRIEEVLLSNWQPAAYKDYRWIVADLRLLGGKLAIRGTRLSVSLILECLAGGMSLEDIDEAFDRAFPHEALPEVLKVASELRRNQRPVSDSREGTVQLSPRKLSARSSNEGPGHSASQSAVRNSPGACTR